MYFALRKGASTSLVTKKSLVKLKVRTLVRKIYTHSVLSLGLYPYVVATFYWFFIRGFEGLYLYNHIQLTNGVFNYFFLVLVFGAFTWG